MKNIDNRHVVYHKEKFDIHPEDKTVHKGKTVICLSTGKVFKSAREAAKFYNIGYSNIIQNLNDYQSQCGGGAWNANEKGLKFSYVADLAYKVNDISKCIEMKAHGASREDLAKLAKENHELSTENETLKIQIGELQAKLDKCSIILAG